MQKTPQGSRLHIGIFGKRNSGKSSLINALTNQELAIVSPVAGTTADPVYKAMEIPPIGPVVLIDTAGLDDVGELGEKRVEKTRAVLDKADLILLVMEAGKELTRLERDFLKEANEKKIPAIGIINKIDLVNEEISPPVDTNVPWLELSALEGTGLEELKELLIELAPTSWAAASIAADLISPGELALLVVSIDQAAPKGRLILPQVQVIRDLLDHNRLALVCNLEDLPTAFKYLTPALVITDSQVFKEVDLLTPKEVPLTSFSILFARYKGDLKALVDGALAIGRLKAGDRVLMSEACTHHRIEDDIGTVKIPRLLKEHVGGELEFEWVSGGTLPQDLTKYDLIVHCGACMLNQRQMLNRLAQAQEARTPIVNYGVLIAFTLGILERALGPFSEFWPQREG